MIDWAGCSAAFDVDLFSWYPQSEVGREKRAAAAICRSLLRVRVRLHFHIKKYLFNKRCHGSSEQHQGLFPLRPQGEKSVKSSEFWWCNKQQNALFIWGRLLNVGSCMKSRTFFAAFFVVLIYCVWKMLQMDLLWSIKQLFYAQILSEILQQKANKCMFVM